MLLLLLWLWGPLLPRAEVRTREPPGAGARREVWDGSVAPGAEV